MTRTAICADMLSLGAANTSHHGCFVRAYSCVLLLSLAFLTEIFGIGLDHPTLSEASLLDLGFTLVFYRPIKPGRNN